jgi:5'-deoxynucleotidase YfbR-like HD superfamily hydrolase
MLTGDIPRPFKHFNSDIRNAIDRAETEIFTKYCNDNDIPKEVHHSTLSAKEGLDGEVVKLADVLCVIGYVAEEIQMGNRLIFSTCVELKTLLPKLEQELTIPVLKEVASLYTIYVSNNMQWPDNL